MQQFDLVVVGSGLGGLVCANLLAKEGYRVCVLEKNRQFGGALQTYARNKVVFDSGVHYIGALDKGQNLYQIFNYLGIMSKLKLKRMDEVFDRVFIGDNPTGYPIAQGYDNFIRHLSAYFPEEEAAIKKYCDAIKDVCARFPMYNLRTGSYSEKQAVLEIDTRTFIDGITENETLRAILGGNNFLYAGEADKTPLYVHALILNHYIESAWKCIDGGSQIAKVLVANIRELGGDIIRNCEVSRLVEEGGRVSYAECCDGKRFYANHFISNLHPSQTMEILQSETIKPVYRNRMKTLANSISSFTISVVLKKDRIPLQGCNYYYHDKGEAWTMADYTEDNWPLGYCVFYPLSSHTDGYAESLTILAYMKYEDVAPWCRTFNTVSNEHSRGADYEAFKREKAEKLLAATEKIIPGLRDAVDHYYCSTPLSYRDYLGTADGSMYGVSKDYKSPLKTFIAPTTRIPNLYLTGQNLNLHGILGVTISAVITSVAVTGNEAIIEKIRNASNQE